MKRISLFFLTFIFINHAFCEQFEKKTYKLPSRYEILLNNQIDFLKSPISVNIHIIPEKNGYNINFIDSQNIDYLLKKHISTLAYQKKIENLPRNFHSNSQSSNKIETLGDIQNHNLPKNVVIERLSSSLNAPFYPIYEETYYFVSFEEAIDKRFKKNFIQFSSSLCKQLQSDKIKPYVENEYEQTFNFQFELKVNTEGLLSVNLLKPQLEEPFKTQLLWRLSLLNKPYPIFDLHQQKYININKKQIIKLICPAIN
ncbi:hypothetical protein ACSNOU_15430 [Acinetobacter oleivorans]|uniref:hypothetical protein n=1 Tax=Acinetobacter oleivorans TaxID=1148157 RepID=UPI003F19419E